ncbi:MAG: uridine kinase [Candidatus Nanohaloarchaea archaeon]|nr:uridine kinase [Candidatus Nanohaloarchaea archaeon]
MIVVGIGGGSGSGKSFMASRIKGRLPEKTLLFSMDRYYRPYDDRSGFERQQINFDLPGTLDWELMREHLRALQRGESIEMPEYSFDENTRVGYVEREPRDIVIVEGIYALYDEAMNDIMDLKVFLSPPADVRAVRRVKRDVVERDRNIEFAARQYLEQTREMHEEHVAPTRENADFVLGDDDADRFVELVTDLFREQEAQESRDVREYFADNL